jgi:hypothetical protein
MLPLEWPTAAWSLLSVRKDTRTKCDMPDVRRTEEPARADE